MVPVAPVVTHFRVQRACSAAGLAYRTDADALGFFSVPNRAQLKVGTQLEHAGRLLPIVLASAGALRLRRAHKRRGVRAQFCDLGGQKIGCQRYQKGTLVAQSGEAAPPHAPGPGLWPRCQLEAVQTAICCP